MRRGRRSCRCCSSSGESSIFDDADPDATELTTEGTLELTEKGLLLTYQETALTGMEGTTTTF